MTSREYLWRTALDHSTRVANLTDEYWCMFEPYMKLPEKYTKNLTEKDYLYLSALFHDVGKLTEEYKHEGSGYFHWMIDKAELLKVFYPKNISLPEKKALIYTVFYVIRNHHEYLGKNSVREPHKNINFIDESISKLHLLAKEKTGVELSGITGRKIGDPRDLSVFGFAQKALEIVSFFDNLDAILTRPDPEKTKLMEKFLSHPDYRKIYHEVMSK